MNYTSNERYLDAFSLMYTLCKLIPKLDHQRSKGHEFWTLPKIRHMCISVGIVTWNSEISLVNTSQNEDKASHTHTHPFNGPLSRTTRVGRYQKGKTNLDFTEARDSEWQWHQLGRTQVCTTLQTDNHASTPPLSFLQAGCPSCRPTNSVKALKALGRKKTSRRL